MRRRFESCRGHIPDRPYNSVFAYIDFLRIGWMDAVLVACWTSDSANKTSMRLSKFFGLSEGYWLRA
ncbi:MAG: hypothetical protein ISP31_07690 [Candidatus Nanopelagicales bacterium]|nr:hypothetical protein [Candidatus Nanopelagicales bacterium]